MEKVIGFLMPLGRINRVFYLSCILFLGVSAGLATLAMANFAELAYICDKLWLIILLYSVSFLFFSLACLGVYLFLIFSMKRLHDFSESGYWAILVFVPVINILLILYLLCMPGDAGRNQFGFEP